MWCKWISFSGRAADKSYFRESASLCSHLDHLQTSSSWSRPLWVCPSSDRGTRLQWATEAGIFQEENQWSESGQYNHLTPEVLKEPLHHVPHPSVLLDLSHCSGEEVESSGEWRDSQDSHSNVHTSWSFRPTSNEKDYEKRDRWRHDPQTWQTGFPAAC